MSLKSILLTNGQRLQAEEITQTEAVGDGDLDYPVGIQGVAALDVGVTPIVQPSFLKLSGSSDMNVDGSSADQLFELLPDTTEILRIRQLRIFMETATAIGYDTFGDIAALNTGDGLLLEVHDGTNQISDLFAGTEILATKHLLPLCEHFQIRNNNLLVADLHLPPIRLSGAATERIRATVRANLSGITSLKIIAVDAVREDVLT